MQAKAKQQHDGCVLRIMRLWLNVEVNNAAGSCGIDGRAEAGSGNGVRNDNCVVQLGGKQALVRGADAHMDAGWKR